MGPSPASRSRLRFLVPCLALAGSLLAVSSFASRALAEETSAADKATARDVATQGIQKYREGQYAEALDLLKRAQAIYDAPVHLQYIARAERELGHWVEAAEVFRVLGKRTLAPDAPEQWVAAVEDARTELAALEPKLPRLLIVLKPNDARVTRLTIDGQEVSAAVIGIERKVNPGDHGVVVEAEGFAKTETHAEARESATTKVEITLEPIGSAAVVPPPAKVEGAGKGASKDAKPKPSHYDVMLGLRLGLAAPSGRVPTRFARPTQEEGDVAMDKVAGNGGELELRAGLTGPLSSGILERFSATVFVSGGSLQGKTLELPDAPALLPLRAGGIELEGKPSFARGGVAFGVGHSRDRFGAFVELGLLAYALTVEYSTNEAVPMCGSVARAKRTGSGGGARLSGGLGFPVGSWGMLTPYLTLSIHSMSTLGFDPDECFTSWYEENDVPIPPSTENVDSVAHSIFGIGLGGEVFLGL
jgi:hypothetical protein